MIQLMLLYVHAVLFCNIWLLHFLLLYTNKYWWNIIKHNLNWTDFHPSSLACSSEDHNSVWSPLSKGSIYNSNLCVYILQHATTARHPAKTGIVCGMFKSAVHWLFFFFRNYVRKLNWEMSCVTVGYLDVMNPATNANTNCSCVLQ